MKTKGGRAMNPTDAFRKEQRKKEINRNKLERKLQREAAQKKADPQKLKKELSDIIALEDQRDGALTQAQRLKKKALLQQYDAAVKQQREEQARKALEQRHGASSAAAASASLWHGAPVRRPEDSVYYHPTKNPTGAPPPGKPQRYKDDVDMAGMIQPGAAPPVLMPAKPPLPAGPAPASTFVLLAPERPPQPAGPQPSASPAPAAPLPPPPGPPPGVTPDAGASGSQPPLPPPPGPPPGMLPPPAAPPPGAALAAMGVAPLAPPPGPPPIMPLLPPPAGPPPGLPQQLLPRKEVRSVISGQSTAKPRVLAQNDKTLTCLVPASVRVKRQGAAAAPAKAQAAGGGKAASHRQDDQYMDFLKDMKELGAFRAL